MKARFAVHHLNRFWSAGRWGSAKRGGNPAVELYMFGLKVVDPATFPPESSQD
jgi:hypothetical protein